ncbi:hypothetical protein Y032_0165g50 [Ancylostoma ceylanicum]|uniref:DNA2/NAM7 helicase-like C-terminal domain-containing protein n=2 Tax=Ancylostoma ceylanicum TaxID=53326 RepID=A0A016SX54_9BILA|nr:hypothetical protein Y032_0165g50 [Ancylostoma ceylanicum]
MTSMSHEHLYKEFGSRYSTEFTAKLCKNCNTFLKRYPQRNLVIPLVSSLNRSSPGDRMGLLRGASSHRPGFNTHSTGTRRRGGFSSAISISPSSSPERGGFGSPLSESSFEDFPRSSGATAYGNHGAGSSRNSYNFGEWSDSSELFDSGARAESRTDVFPFGEGIPKESRSNKSSAIDHPWAHLVKPRRLRFEDLTDDQVDSTLSLDIYGHVPRDGYLSEKFARTLFPLVTGCDVMLEKFPVVELQTLRDAVDFRKRSQKVIDDLLEGDYSVKDYPLMKTAENSMPSLLAPPTIDGRRPVLYQVVYASREEELLILEAKDFFLMLPDRLDLHCIVLNEQSMNVQSHKLGFDPRLVSIKDFVWVWTVEPTGKALEDPATTLRKSRWPRLTAFHHMSVYFFRAAQFAFVRPAIQSEQVYGSVLSIQGKWSPVDREYNPVYGFKAAFEGAPEAIRLNQSVCDFPLIEVQRGGHILLAESRRNVSTAVRFSEPAASPEAEHQLCKFIKYFLPSHPDEGIMPIMVRRLSLEDKQWFNDRLGKFDNYKRNPENARKKMSKVFNMACSSLEACKSLDDDRRIHWASALVSDVSASPLRLEVVLRKMFRECGWAPGKPVLVWAKGARKVSRFLVEKIANKPDLHELAVTLVARQRSQDHLIRDFAYRGDRGGLCVNVWVMLGKLPTSASPLYETVSRMRLFDNLHPGSLGNTILDAVYCRRSLKPIVERLRVSKEQLRGLTELTVGGKKITLTLEQQKAVLLGCAGYPVVGIPANFGSGKTLVAAVLAAMSRKERVILTGATNEVVAKVANTLCSIGELRNIKVLRYVSLVTTWKDRHSTPVDMDQVLKTLGDDFDGDIQSTADRSTCRSFRERLSASLTAQEREELELVETNVSSLLKDMIRIMFSVRFPDVICLTTSSLLNVFSHNGIFADQGRKFSLVICDEAGQVPEAMFIAITNRLPHVRQVYIGDQLQFAPHTRINNSRDITQLGARSCLDVLLDVHPKPAPVMRKSFTAHPALNVPPRLVSYEENLVDGATPGDRRLALDLLPFPHSTTPFLFVDVVFSESEIAESKSSFNILEAEVCERVVTGLLDKGVRARDVTIVNFYKEQQRRLAEFAQDIGVENTTVESFQNSHNEIVVLLTTKAELEDAYREKASDFLEESQRLVTALTRARQGLIILGSEHFLNRGNNWKKIINWARGFNGIMKSSELHKFLGGSSLVRREGYGAASLRMRMRLQGLLRL